MDQWCAFPGTQCDRFSLFAGIDPCDLELIFSQVTGGFQRIRQVEGPFREFLSRTAPVGHLGGTAAFIGDQQLEVISVAPEGAGGLNGDRARQQGQGRVAGSKGTQTF